MAPLSLRFLLDQLEPSVLQEQSIRLANQICLTTLYGLNRAPLVGPETEKTGRDWICIPLPGWLYYHVWGVSKLLPNRK